MKQVSRKSLLEAAHNLMFNIDEIELDILKEEYADLVTMIEEMKAIPHIDEVKPMIYPYDVMTDYLREDIKEQPLPREEALKNASKVEKGQIVIPKVVK